MDVPGPAAGAVPDVPRDMDDPAPAPKAPVEAEPAAEAVETTPVAPPEVPRDTDGPETVSEAPAETGAARWHPDFSAPIPAPTPEPTPEPDPGPTSEPESEAPAESEPESNAPETLEERWGRAFAGDGRDRLVDLIEPEA